MKEKLFKWAKETALPWLKTGWIHLASLLVIFIAYGHLNGAVEIFVGFWAFILSAYWLFWKLLGGDKMIKGAIAQRRKRRK